LCTDSTYGTGEDVCVLLCAHLRFSLLNVVRIVLFATLYRMIVLTPSHSISAAQNLTLMAATDKSVLTF